MLHILYLDERARIVCMFVGKALLHNYERWRGKIF